MSGDESLLRLSSWLSRHVARPVVAIGTNTRASELARLLGEDWPVQSCPSVREAMAEAATAMAIWWVDLDMGEELPSEHELGALCRVFPEGVLVQVVGAAPRETTTRFYAFGFRRVDDLSDEAPAGSPSIRSYQFRLGEYKPAPSWLNARHWAHPERFDLDPDENSPFESDDDDDDESDETDAQMMEKRPRI